MSSVTEDQVAEAQALDRRQAVANRLDGLQSRQTKLSGFEDAETKDLVDALNSLRARELPTMAPLLRLLFQLKGRPYTLDNHFPFEPFFRTWLPQKAVLVTGRQLSKSTSLAAQSITLATSIPYFNTLIVTPLFEQVRRFSHNYVRDLIENSPVKKLLTSRRSAQSVLQRSFTNGSMLQFSYAFLDAERVRGIPADRIVVDESIYLYTPLIVTSKSGISAKFIVDVTPGESVLSFDSEHRIVWRKILAKSHHGRRACFRLTTRSGRAVVATAETWLATNCGWRRISQIIQEVAKRSDARSEVGQAEDAVNAVQAAAPTGLGYDARRRAHGGASAQNCRVPQQSRLGASRVQLDQVPNIIAVRQYAAREATERRLRRVVESLRNVDSAGIYLLVSPDLPLRVQASDSELASENRACRDLANNRLVDRGRRLTIENENRHRVNDDQYAQLFAQRSSVACDLATEAQSVLYGDARPQEGDWCDLLGHQLFQSGDAVSRREDPALHAAADALQGYVAVQAGDSALYILRPRFQAEPVVQRSEAPRVDPRVLSAQALSPRKSCGTSSLGVLQGPCQAPETQRQNPRALRAQCRSQSPLQPRESSPASLAEPAALLPSQEALAPCAAGRATLPPVGVSTLRQDRAAGATRFENAILRSLPPASHQAVQEGLRAAQEGREAHEQLSQDHAVPGVQHAGAGESGPRMQAGTMQREMQGDSRQSASPSENSAHLIPDDLVKIEFAGYHDVYDIEVEGTQTFLANGVASHNCQDLLYDFLPIIIECMSASPWKLELFAGTPKSLDNTLAAIHQDSSQAEWLIKCRTAGCGHWNVPALSHDLWDMIGPYRDDISEQSPGVVCAKCRKPLNPRTGRWTHACPDRATTFAGYHIPQIIMPMHYADKTAWATLLGKMAGHGNTTRAQFLNEVCGVASDEGSKLVSLTDIQAAACLPWRNDWREAEKHVRKYRFRVLAVDWGGGGGRLRSSAGRGRGDTKRLRSSFTTLAVLGLLPEGRIDVIWGYRSLRTHEYEWEARLCLETLAKFQCSHLMHDYSNAGAAREVLLRQAGWPYQNIMPLRYHGAASHGAISYNAATDDHPRDWYSLDRSYTLMLTCQCIKHGVIRFFQDDYQSTENPGVLRDFLSLIEEKMDSRVGTDVFSIQRNPFQPDDFAHSVNYGACGLWYMSKQWPDLAAAARMKLHPDVLNKLHPMDPLVNWNAL